MGQVRKFAQFLANISLYMYLANGNDRPMDQKAIGNQVNPCQIWWPWVSLKGGRQRDQFLQWISICTLIPSDQELSNLVRNPRVGRGKATPDPKWRGYRAQQFLGPSIPTAFDLQRPNSAW